MPLHKKIKFLCYLLLRKLLVALDNLKLTEIGSELNNERGRDKDTDKRIDRQKDLKTENTKR